MSRTNLRRGRRRSPTLSSMPLSRRSRRLAVPALLAVTALVLGGCTKGVSERCSGRMSENTCSVAFDSSDGTWRTSLEGGELQTEVTINGTFTIESGSGTLTFWGPEESMQYELSAEHPVEVVDLTMTMYRSEEGDRGDTSVTLETVAEGTLDGFSGEYSFVTR